MTASSQPSTRLMAAATGGDETGLQSGSGLEERLTAAFHAYVDFVIADPKAAHLLHVDSLDLGARGVSHRRQAAQTFEAMLRQSFAESPERGEVL